MNEDACSTVVKAVEKYGGIVAGSAEDLETKVNEESTDMGEATTDKGAGNH